MEWNYIDSILLQINSYYISFDFHDSTESLKVSFRESKFSKNGTLNLILSPKHGRGGNTDVLRRIDTFSFHGVPPRKFGSRVNFRCLGMGIIVLTNFTDGKWDISFRRRVTYAELFLPHPAHRSKWNTVFTRNTRVTRKCVIAPIKLSPSRDANLFPVLRNQPIVGERRKVLFVLFFSLFFFFYFALKAEGKVISRWKGLF